MERQEQDTLGFPKLFVGSGKAFTRVGSGEMSRTFAAVATFAQPTALGSAFSLWSASVIGTVTFPANYEPPQKWHLEDPHGHQLFRQDQNMPGRSRTGWRRLMLLPVTS